MHSTTIKVYVPTYRRGFLLKRALASLLAQTYSHWHAEIHNDDPTDPIPARLVEQINDPRIKLVTHERNLGALDTFNLIFSPCEESYMSLLEDDNAWEPEFLSQLFARLEACPEAILVWCNQHLDEEQENGEIRALGATARPAGAFPDGSLHRFGSVIQAFGAIHANGAMLLRCRAHSSYPTPSTIAFTGIEAYRERLFEGPLLYVDFPLARFTITRHSARYAETRGWSSLQTALVASFVRASSPTLDIELFSHSRSVRPKSVNLLIQAGLGDPACRRLLRRVNPAEYVRWLLTACRHPRTVIAGLKFNECKWWPQLAEITRTRLINASTGD